MAIRVETRDCSSLVEDDLNEMLELCASSDTGLDKATLEKQVAAWVLHTEARIGEQLVGFIFCTLERIGGTPCVLQGAGHVERNDQRAEILTEMITDQMRRAAMSFPDEDVLFGGQLSSPGGFEAFGRFHEIIPRPDCKPNGEDRAWGQRLAKRFGISLMRYKDRTFVSSPKSFPPVAINHETLDKQWHQKPYASFFDSVKTKNGDTLIVHGWVRSEELEVLV